MKLARACHESGHAVVAMMHGIHVRAVTLEYTECAPAIVGLGRTAVEPRIIVAMAGPTAQARASKRSLRECWLSGGSADLDEVLFSFDIADLQGWGCADREWSWLRYQDDTRRIVRAHWHRIERVARVLLERRTLASDELIDLAGLDLAGHDLARRETLAPCGRAAVQTET